MDKYPKSEGATWLFMDNPIANAISEFVHGLKNSGQLDGSNLPHFKGRIIVTDDQIRKLIAMRKAGQEPQVQIGLWFRTPKSGGPPYTYLGTEVYMKEGQNQQQNQNQQGYGQQQQQQQPYQPPQQQQMPPQDSGGFDDDDIPF